MFCVTCGTALQAENDEGTTCQQCRRKYLRSSRKRAAIVLVKHCYACGEAYQPHDASIQHDMCSALYEKNGEERSPCFS